MGDRRNGAAALLAGAAVGLMFVSCAPSARVGVAHAHVVQHLALHPSAAWHINGRQAADGITGFADRTMVTPGDAIHLFVSTRAPSYTVTAYRMGWYDGLGAAWVWQSRRRAGVVQPDATVSSDTNTVVAPWKRSLPVSTSGWPEGAYLFVLAASDGSKHYVPLVVHSTSTAGKIVLLDASATWQAYNAWGGYSLYHGPYSDGRHRAKVVSFDRPYDGTGADLFLAFERPVIAFAEQLRLPLAYVTSEDLATQPDLLRGSRAVVSMGHDEYWTSGMRDALLAARDAGTNVAFLGANAVFRHIRFDPSPIGPNRLEVNYRTEADPMLATDPAEVTTNWREPPLARPESELTGALYECNPVSAAYVVTTAKRWPFSAAKVTDGTTFPGLVGPEYDRVDPAYKTPRPIEVLAHSPVVCHGRSSYADTSYYTVSSGAGVFDAGTMRWACALGGGCRNHGVDDAATRFVQRVTKEVLRAFAGRPVGANHPAADNVDTIGEAFGDATAR